MFERFTDQSRRTVVLAQEECLRLGHQQIDPEHMLLALLMQPEAAATRVLTELGVDTAALAGDVERAIGRGSRPRSRGGHIPFQPLTKRVLERALREALLLDHQHIGTEHLLLGLIDVGDSMAASALRGAGVEPDRLRERVAALGPTETSPGRGRRDGESLAVGLIPELTALRLAKDAALDRGDVQAAVSFRGQERELLRRLREEGTG